MLKMQPQGVDAVTDADHIALYTKIVSSVPQLFFRPINNATPIQLSSEHVFTARDEAEQYTFMAGPFIIYGGFKPAVLTGQVITLSPTSDLLYVGLTISRTGIGPSAGIAATDINAPQSTFRAVFPGVVQGAIYYFAVGIPA